MFTIQTGVTILAGHNIKIGKTWTIRQGPYQIPEQDGASIKNVANPKGEISKRRGQPHKLEWLSLKKFSKHFMKIEQILTKKGAAEGKEFGPLWPHHLMREIPVPITVITQRLPEFNFVAKQVAQKVYELKIIQHLTGKLNYTKSTCMPYLRNGGWDSESSF